MPSSRYFLLLAIVSILLPASPSAAHAQRSSPTRIEVRCHVFQTVRDAPVVPGKPTVIRVYADWTEENGPANQLEFHDATVRIRAGGEDLPEMKKTFFRPDRHERVDSVNAEISANHYGWRPPPGDGRSPIPVHVEVEFESSATGAKYIYDAACPVVALPSAPTLKIDYYFVRTREWLGDDWDESVWGPVRQAYEDSGWPWPGEWGLIKERGHRFMEGSARYAVRNLPVGGISLRYGGEMTYEHFLFAESAWDLGSALYDRANRAYPGADVIVGIVPPSLGDDWLGVMMYYSPSRIPGLQEGPHYSRVLGGKRVVLLELDEPDGGSPESVLAHELGHFYGLCHTFPVSPPDGPPRPGPRTSRPSEENACVRTEPMQSEGFLIFRGGGGGMNKSATEGNQTIPDLIEVPVGPVMDSGSVSKEITWRWMANEQYARLIHSFELLGFYGRPEGATAPLPGWWAHAGQPGRGLATISRPVSAGSLRTASGRGVPVRFVENPGPSLGDSWMPVEVSPSSVSAPQPAPAEVMEPYLIVAGMVGPDGTVRLRPLRFTELDLPLEEEPGDFRLEVRGTDGRVIHAESFAPLIGERAHGPPSSATVFEVAVPLEAGIAEVVVSRGGTVLARRAGSPSAPRVAILSPAPGAAWDGSTPLRWEGTDADGDALVYDVYYSPDGGARWTTLALGTSDTQLDGVRPDDLDIGSDPRFRVVALDGFHAGEVEQGVAVRGGFRVLASTPGADGTVAVGDDIVSVRFNRPIGPATLSGMSFTLHEQGGQAVPARVELGPDEATARLILDGELLSGSTYEVVVSDAVSDIFGNRLPTEVRWVFRTEADGRRPRVIGMQPMPGALGIGPEALVTVRFDEPMEPGSIGPPGLRVETDGGPVAGEWRYDAESLSAIFEPANPLTSSAMYRVTVTENVTDGAGNAVRAPQPWTFRVIGQLRPGGS